MRVSSGAQTGDTGGDQPFGGSGSNRVCDRDKLLRFLKANLERMRAWALALGRYQAWQPEGIAQAVPATSPRHAHHELHVPDSGGRPRRSSAAPPCLLISGTPVVRCLCGNRHRRVREDREVRRLSRELHAARAVARPPSTLSGGLLPPRVLQQRATTRFFISRHRRSRYGDCYAAYPDPPVVTFINVFADRSRGRRRRARILRRMAQPGEPSGEPPAQEPDGSRLCAPRSQAEFEQCCERQGGCATRNCPASLRPEQPRRPPRSRPRRPLPSPTSAPTG